MENEHKEYKCKECGMQFDDPVRLDRHFRAAHPTKHSGFRQKWYWEN